MSSDSSDSNEGRTMIRLKDKEPRPRVDIKSLTKNWRKQNFSSTWRDDPKFKPWLEKSTKSSSKKEMAFCRICEIHLTCGRSIFLMHMKSKKHRESSKIIRVGILTIGDSCWNGDSSDTSGPALIGAIENGAAFKGKVSYSTLCPDDEDRIKEVIVGWCNSDMVDLIITTGGTGISPRDVTPEAVKAILHKELPGMARMISESLKITPIAMLSRPVCGIKGKTLIITLPGSKISSVECLSFLAPALTRAIDQIRNVKYNREETHTALQTDVNDDQPSSVVSPKISPSAQPHVSWPYPMISVEEGQNIILALAEPSECVEKSFSECLNYVLADDVFAKANIPPCPVSKKEGFAVRCSDGLGQLTVHGESIAGDTAECRNAVPPYSCMGISTGAIIPSGAAGAVKVEDTHLLNATGDSEEDAICFETVTKFDEFISEIGCDMREGELLLPIGTVLSPADIGVLVSSGNETVRVYPKPKIALICNVPLCPFVNPKDHIFDSNRPTLTELFEKYADEVHDMGHVIDSVYALHTTIAEAFLKADIVVTTTSVSMGELQLLKPVLEHDFAAKTIFRRVCMKPGKTTTFATCLFDGRRKFVFCFPGNPDSAVVAATLFALPLCRKISGLGDRCRGTTIKVKLNDPILLDEECWKYSPVRLADCTSNVRETVSTGIPLAYTLITMSAASALLILPPRSNDRRKVLAGEQIYALLLDA